MQKENSEASSNSEDVEVFLKYLETVDPKDIFWTYTRKKQSINATVKETISDIICGLHSGFKPCCVFWFVTFWTYHIRTHNCGVSKCSYMKFAKPVFSPKNSAKYIPCPFCGLFERYVEVQKCNCGKMMSKYNEEHGIPTRRENYFEHVNWKTFIKICMRKMVKK